MSKVYEFLKECENFYVLTINGDFPAGRPFGAVMEYNGMLYISTNTGNKVHKQLRENGNIQIPENAIIFVLIFKVSPRSIL